MTHSFSNVAPKVLGRTAAYNTQKQAGHKRPHVNLELLAKQARSAARYSNEHAESMVMKHEVPRKQRAPFYDIRIMGVCTEYTDDSAEGHAAYFGSASYPKEMWKVDATGARTLVMRLHSAVATRV